MSSPRARVAGVALPSLQDQLLHTPLSGDLAGTRRRRASLAPLIHPCKTSGVHHVRFSAGCLQVSPAGASPHGLSSSCSVSGRNLGRHTSVTLYGPLVAYYVRHLVWLRAARFQSLDFFAQVAGEVCAVRRLEVTKGSHGCREMIPLPLQVVEHFSAAIFNLTIELPSATVCNGIETLCIDPGFRLDPRGTCTGVGGELTCGSAGLLSDPVGIRCNFLDQAFGLLRGHLDQADDGRAGFLSSCPRLGRMPKVAPD
jgi:hypothetical protein